MRIAASIALVLALAACKQEDAPSDTIKDAAETIVEQVDGSAPTPKLAQGKYAPRDECRDQPGAEDFREQLASAVESRDADLLVALAAPDVKLNFGGGAGAGRLRAELMKSDWSLWDELDTLLALGCGVNAQGGITIPWYATQTFDSVADPGMGMIVTGEDVPIREQPDAEAPAKATISWGVVELVGGLHPEDEFQEVKAADGTQGFVATGKLRSLLDYRLVASSRDGRWSFTSLTAGD